MSFAIGAKRILTTAAPVQLPSQAVGSSGCFLWANPSNKEKLYLSTSAVLPNEEQRITLIPGEGKRLFPANLNQIYAVVEAAGDIVEWATS